MAEAIYEKLAETLTLRGGAMPALKCPEFFELVQELFTTEEADLAAKMPLNPTTAETLAREIDTGDPKEVERILESMANKGLVIARERGEARYYSLMALLPGIFEMQFMKGEVSGRTKKLARLFEDYFNVAPERAVANGAILPTFPFARVISVEAEIPVGIEIHPYDRVSEYISMADYIAVSVCYCRHHGELLGRPCDKPKEVCLIFGPQAKFIDERGFGRLVSKEEAVEVLDRCEDAGLVHCSTNISKYIDFICNCCDCHCFILQSVKNSAVPSMGASSSFVMNVEEEECIGCGDCVERCQMDALIMKDDIVVRDVLRCIGCGLCVSVCPTEALRMELREAALVPPFDRRELREAMVSSLRQLPPSHRPAAGQR
ncbi:4Fe-4S binding protein, partial [Dehalococcoidia bacterium]|nr:4Fe-4S binding protein [Dehalococcoidia bacterium]